MIERVNGIVYVTKPIGDISNCIEMRGKDWVYLVEVFQHRITHVLIYGDVKGRGYCIRIEKPQLAFHETFRGDFRDLLKELKDMRPKEAYEYIQNVIRDLSLKR